MRRLVPVAALLAIGLSACSSLFGSGAGGSGYGSSGPMTEPQVRQLLRDQGYTGLSDLHYTGKDWAASARRGGNPVEVHVDQYGIIHTE